MPDPVIDMKFPQHPDRSYIQAEAHARPPLDIEIDKADIWHWALVGGEDDDWPAPFQTNKRHKVMSVEDGIIRFEQHTEFVSLTYMGNEHPSQATVDLIRDCPGIQLVGTRILFMPFKECYPEHIFGRERIFGGLVKGSLGEVRIYTTFKVNPDGHVTYLVEGDFESGFAKGNIAKILIDLETYRNMSLLALPIVRDAYHELQSIEVKTSETIRELSDHEAVSLDGLIQNLATILSRIGELNEELRYRIAASKAYYDIVISRLDNLSEHAIGQHQTLREFVEHRLSPAMKTITAFDKRLEDNATAIRSAMALARTRLDLFAQSQNQKLLRSMEKRARQQVHLAQAVEGLSVAAITYYAVGLLGYGLKGIPDFTVSDNQIMALSIPFIALSVFALTRQAKKRVIGID